MRGAYLEFGEFIQRAFKDQVLQRDGGVERIADDIRQPAVALEAARQLRRALRMDEQRNAQFFGFGPHRMIFRIREIIAQHAAANGSTLETVLAHAVLKLLNREIGELQRE